MEFESEKLQRESTKSTTVVMARTIVDSENTIYLTQSRRSWTLRGRLWAFNRTRL